MSEEIKSESTELKDTDVLKLVQANEEQREKIILQSTVLEQQLEISFLKKQIDEMSKVIHISMPDFRSRVPLRVKDENERYNDALASKLEDGGFITEEDKKEEDIGYYFLTGVENTEELERLIMDFDAVSSREEIPDGPPVLAIEMPDFESRLPKNEISDSLVLRLVDSEKFDQVVFEQEKNGTQTPLKECVVNKEEAVPVATYSLGKNVFGLPVLKCEEDQAYQSFYKTS
jgi:hypothetical protein